MLLVVLTHLERFTFNERPQLKRPKHQFRRSKQPENKFPLTKSNGKKKEEKARTPTQPFPGDFAHGGDPRGADRFSVCVQYNWAIVSADHPASVG